MKTFIPLILVLLTFCSACDDDPTHGKVEGNLCTTEQTDSIEMIGEYIFLYDALQVLVKGKIDSAKVQDDLSFTFDAIPFGRYYFSMTNGFILEPEDLSVTLNEDHAFEKVEFSVYKKVEK